MPKKLSLNHFSFQHLLIFSLIDYFHEQDQVFDLIRSHCDGCRSNTLLGIYIYFQSISGSSAIGFQESVIFKKANFSKKI